MLSEGFHAVPDGHVAAVVTHLRMDRPTDSLPPGLSLRLVETPDIAWYRDLFTRVGAVDWLWFSRLQMSDDDLGAILRDPDVEVRVLEVDGRAEGLMELDFRQQGTCELAFFGLTPSVQGKGLGRGMMQSALHHGFARDVPEMTVHTCTFDSPVALPFYVRTGFVPVRREVEVVPDPRLGEALPEGAAGHIPVILP